MAYRFPAVVLAVALLSSTANAGVIGKPLLPPEPPKIPVSPYSAPKAPESLNAPMLDLIVAFREGRTIVARATQLRSDIARFDREIERRTPRTDAAREDARIDRTFSRLFFGASVRVRREMREEIAKLPYVASVHIARQFQAAAVGATANSLARKMRTLETTQGAGVTVAVIDTGIDYLHPALGGGIGEGFKVVGGWDFANDDADPMDDYGHGTHVAGIIAAESETVTGVAPKVSLIAYKVLGAGGFGQEGDVIAAIERLVDPNEDGDTSDRVDIANLSLGGPILDGDPVSAAVERATQAGVLLCVANGNSGDYGYVGSPANAPSALSVGAVDRNDVIASFSTRGPSYHYGIKPEVVAPGIEILSSLPGGGWAESNGTSMATPHVAGIAALVKAQHPDWTPAEIKSAIVSTSHALEDEIMIVGAGRADAIAATTMTTLATPGLLNFGKDQSKQPTWTTTRTVTLRNLGDSPQTLTSNVLGLREGISMRITPNVVTLPPGASQTVEVELSVVNALVPAPRKDSMSFGGRIVWSGGAVPVQVAWGFVKAVYLQVKETAGGSVYARVFGERGVGGVGEFIGSAHIFWPIEPVDVLVANWGSPSYVKIVEQVDVETTSVVEVNIDEASFTVTPSSMDAQGISIDANGRECAQKLVLGFPPGRYMGIDQWSGAPTRFAPFSERVKIYMLHSCGDAATSTVYAAMHPPIAGLQSSITSSLTDAEWLEQEVHFTPDAPEERTMIIALASLRFPGPNEAFFFGGGSSFLLRQTGPRLKYVYTKSPAPEVDLISIVEWWTRCHWESLGHDGDCPLLDWMFLYLNEDGIAAETDIFLDISPMAYRIPRSETMTYGRGQVFPHVRMGAEKDFFWAQAWWMGALGERRIADTVNGTVAMYDASGAKLQEARIGFEALGALPKGRYRVEAIDPHLLIANITGKATFNGWVDTNHTDVMMPIFTGIRLVDGQERQVNVVDRDASASLLFSASDLKRGKVVFLERTPINEEKTRVEYRSHRTGQWKPLPAPVAARHYPLSTFLNGGVGTMYRVDLGAVTSSMTGAVDVRMFVEDSSGNSAELTLEPALWIGEIEGRRRGARH